MHFADLAIHTIRDGLAKKTFSCRELISAHLARIEAVDATIHAFLQVTQEAALQQADVVDKKIAAGETLKSLDGVPVAIKDVLVTKGVPTTAASKILEGYVPPYTATAVERLYAAGAIMLGKTNCDEFAMGASGEHSAYGPTRNPWDTERVPGGSSSGSAAAVASGMSIAALGTDTGGSVRQPAGFCGVVGVKPTYGRVSRYGLIALASSLDQVGVLTRSVDDAAFVLQAISGQDAQDATSVDMPVPNPAALSASDLKGVRIGLPSEYFIEGMDPAVERLVRATADTFAAAGATTVDISLPHTEYGLAVYYIIQPAEASTNLARYDGIRFGKRVDAETLERVYHASRDAGFGAEPKRRIMLGTYALSAGYYDAYYRKAQKVRTLIRQDFADAFRSVDAILAPTSPGVPFRLGDNVQDPLTMYLADVFTVPANIAGIPGISIPCGWVGGLPVGAQLMGPMWSEERLLMIAAAAERALALPRRLPNPG